MSELRERLDFESFKKMYLAFMNQAERNKKTRKSQGSRTPLGFIPKSNDVKLDGAVISQHFGQGAASKTPYISWYVVSIYYIVDVHRIYVGIEMDRYPYLDKMEPKEIIHIGNKDTCIAVFYYSQSDNLDFKALYDSFINVSEEVMKLGVVF